MNSRAKGTGGKGNVGMFIERDPKIYAAGLRSLQPNKNVLNNIQHYLLQEEAEALIHDAIVPPPKPAKLPTLRRQIPLDMRNAGPFGQAARLLNPPIKTKFQTLVEDFKETAYNSYWKQPLGRVPDQVPSLPEGFDIYGTTLGRKTPRYGSLYDIIMPTNPIPDKTPISKRPSYQTDRNYCKDSYNPEKIFGKRENVDPRGRFMKCCLTDDRITLGNSLATPINTIQRNYLSKTRPILGVPTTPNDNISCVPKGYTFGKLKPPDNLPECLTTCDLNPDREFFKQCLRHLNNLRKCLSKRYDGPFFQKLYLSLKYIDKEKTGWLPRMVVYDYIATKYIRFDPSLIEPLLSMWEGFDGSKINYKIFVHVINHREPSPECSKIWDVPDKCLDFNTTYRDMVKPNQEVDRRLRAGLPSGRYFDMDYPIAPTNCCKADIAYLPQESDAKVCLSPSVWTLLGVSHRDMFTRRSPETIKKVFEASGEKLSDEKFDAVWKKAEQYHPQGLVCFETFKRALNEVSLPSISDKEAK